MRVLVVVVIVVIVVVVVIVVMPIMMLLAMVSTLDDDVLRFLFAMRMQHDVLAGPVICCGRETDCISRR